MQYPVRSIPFDPRNYATADSLRRIAAFSDKAAADLRQPVIEYVIKAHAFATDHTKSLQYDPALDLPGRNVRGHILIGPRAFKQDVAWLAGIVFHELIHSPQYMYYATRGIAQINPKQSETERVMIALDEFEAYWWSLKRRKELSLSPSQQAEIEMRARHALIDIDDPEITEPALKQRFDAARDVLIRRYQRRSTGGSTVMRARMRSASCCASA